VDEFLSDQLPEVTFHWPEATYLLWLDFRRLGLPQHALKELLIRNARLALNNGTDFGADGEGFMRLNIACPQATLKNALIQLKIAVDALK
jgi:cystathionine beta-lyase